MLSFCEASHCPAMSRALHPLRTLKGIWCFELFKVENDVWRFSCPHLDPFQLHVFAFLEAQVLQYFRARFSISYSFPADHCSGPTFVGDIPIIRHQTSSCLCIFTNSLGRSISPELPLNIRNCRFPKLASIGSKVRSQMARIKTSPISRQAFW
jgi:hypothetical protein